MSFCCGPVCSYYVSEARWVDAQIVGYALVLPDHVQVPKGLKPEMKRRRCYLKYFDIPATIALVMIH